MTDLTQALAVGRDDTRRFSVALIDLEKAYNNALAADVDVVSAMWMNLSMDCAKVSNDLIPRADADLAVALMVEKARSLCKTQAGLSKTNDYDLAWCRCAGYLEYEILTLTPASALAELQALRAERDDAVASQFITRVERDGAEDHATETADELRQVRARAEAAEAANATLRAQNERLTGSLRFYADFHENPNDGPWGVNSQDFGKEARAALTEGAAP